MAEKMTEKYGEPIEGSRFVRDRCAVCREPIRVVDISQFNRCHKCDPFSFVPGPRDSAVYSDIQYHGGRYHAGEW